MYTNTQAFVIRCTLILGESPIDRGSAARQLHRDKSEARPGSSLEGVLPKPILCPYSQASPQLQPNWADETCAELAAERTLTS